MFNFLLASTPNVGQKSAFSDSLRDWLGDSKEVVVLPYGTFKPEESVMQMERLFSPFGVKVLSTHSHIGRKDSKQTIFNSDRIVVGPGNTFRQIRAMQKHALDRVVIQQLTRNEAKYLGIGAGAVLASPTIKTTNDMPIVTVDSLDALSLVNFQVNPHYLPHIQSSSGESRSKRIEEFLEDDKDGLSVLGLYENSFIRGDKNGVVLEGDGAAIFSKRGTNGDHTISINHLEAGANLSNLGSQSVHWSM